MASLFLPNISNSTGVSTSQNTDNTTSAGKNTATTTGAGAATGEQAQQNTYSPFQQQLQGEAANQAGQYLATGVAPGTQASLDAQTAAYEQNFKQNVEPQLAAQYGAGSPAIAAEESQGLVNLTSNVFQNQGSQFNAALGTAGNLAYNATGSTGQTAAANNNTSNTTGSWQELQNEVQNMSSAANNFGISTT